VLGTVLRDDRDASLHLHVSRVVGYDLSSFEFYFFLLGFYLRDLLPIPMELARPMQALYTLCSFWTVWSCIYIYYYFVYYVIDLFYSFSLPYARFVVRT
jgi:hypothetical protein